MRRFLLTLVLMLMTGLVQAAVLTPAKPDFIVLTYHDVRDDVGAQGDHDPDAINTDHLIAHFDWLKANGYRVVSLEQVVRASHGGPALPEHAVLLTFDDGLESFYTRVYPLLRAYDYPAVSALVGSWIDMPAGQQMAYNGAQCTRDCFMTWDQIREIQKSGLVEFASHTWQLHMGIPGNPQNNQMPSVTTLRYDMASHSYESDEAYLERLRVDLRHSSDEIAKETGHRPRAIVWPYGSYNKIAVQIAASEGLDVSFSLDDKLPDVQVDSTIPRLLISGNINANRLGWLIRHQQRIDPVRAVQVDLDYVYDPDPAQQERNLSVLLDRIKRMQPSQVWLQAYADPKGDGVAEAVYFPNRHLPMRADLFSRVAWQLRTRAGVRVYAWMPVLAFRFPDAPNLPSLAGEPKPGGDHYRLAPWDPKVEQWIGDVYEDLAMHADEAGLLFSDDAYLRDTDNLGPWSNRNPAQRTAALIGFTHALTDRVRRWRPLVKTVRNIYTRPIFDPAAEAWFAQSLPAFLAGYDMTAIMAMPQLDKQRDTASWYRDLVARVKAIPDALNHTLFELASHDWRSDQPISEAKMGSRIRLLQTEGVRHLAYYPDDFIKNQPRLEIIRPSISIADYPYPEPSR
ncbi:poly-beta-1,6-N-acetyl-D-glucosamine N-deacetylase PgaB [Dyella caseinilytica]|uniref:Poly-beta-1,6-N-acetyl-D-glucosamine N-deacetylase PgaB n=1 Tax=Dyella caseinilytica TaxID=1849581 RepID=A0ABX7GWV3_9GAMM|nr:poly-beta-1,6-N-acetyl-D-glucosamine N-deacetylase PgaB [Dyella caseinilytica]QRN54970.1 poly-beta-1,6-N-acetyl-D-glucosamine N-deacetylase PgaB [Dyella caseinilytica]GFZ98322.1 poly-beta-1,6-N-acetyl-D-glucosamine N-deacetylase PgaB [Dyella caseinilytica]